VDSAVTGEARFIDPAVDRALLLAGREALRNAVRHARPATIHIAATYDARSVTLEVADDGAGFDPGTMPADDSHFGIEGMRERIEQTGGTFAIQSRRGGGATVRMTAPLGTRSDSGNALNAARDPALQLGALQLNNAAVQSRDGGLRPVGDVQSAEDQVDVPLHGGLGDA
jgi:signal transduction histidine kinase